MAFNPYTRTPNRTGLTRAGLVPLGITPPEWAGSMDAPLPARFYDKQNYYRPGWSLSPREKEELAPIIRGYELSAPKIASADPSFAPQQTGGIIDISSRNNLARSLGLKKLDPVQGFVIHHTGPGMKTVNDVVNVFQNRGYPAQFVIDRTGQIFQTLPTGYEGFQIVNTSKYKPVAATGLSNINTIGVEVMAADDGDVLPAQIDAAKQLYSYLATDPAAAGWNASGLPPSQVFSHGVLNPGDKMPTEGLTITSAIRSAYGAPTYDPKGFLANPMSFADPQFMAKQEQAVFGLRDPNLDPGRDAAIRTAYAEDTRNPLAPLSVIYNRTLDARFPGDLMGVVSQQLVPGAKQFDGYQSKLYNSLKPTDPVYQQIGKALDEWQLGMSQPPTGAVFFWNPATGSKSAFNGIIKNNAYAGTIGGQDYYGEVQPKPGVTAGAPAQAAGAEPALSVGGQPVWVTTAPDATTTKLEAIPNDTPGGIGDVIKAAVNGDVKATKAAWDKTVGRLMFAPAETKKAAMDWMSNIPTAYPNVAGALKEAWPVVNAAFQPAKYSPVPDVRKDYVDESGKKQLGLDARIAAIKTPDVAAQSYPEWDVVPQTDEDIASTLFGGSDSGGGFLSPKSEPKTSGVSAWNATAQMPFSTPATPAPQYPKATPAAPESEAKPPAPSPLTSALAGMGAGQGFGLGTLPAPTPPEADPAAQVATLIPTVTGKVSFTPPPAQPASLTPQALAGPKKPYGYVQNAQIANAATRGMSPGGANMSMWGGFPSLARVAAAAQGAGYTTGVGSPGYLSNPTVQQALTRGGYSAPNFSKGSGGAIYAYKPDGNGGGTYVNSFGQTMTY